MTGSEDSRRRIGAPARSSVVLALAIALGVAAASAGAADAPAGDAERGRQVFEVKQCSGCHRPLAQGPVGPALDDVRRPQGAYEFAGRLWNHAPAMFTVLSQKGLTWPPIEPAEMADLMAFLRAGPERDPAPDRARGQTILVRKGCLKCHSYRGEGGRLGPDLAERRERYAPPAAWAATVWKHAPRMAVTAIQHGVLYPRFTGDEMVHLLGLLRGGEAVR
jgi:cytochrome c2